jgi:flagellar motility protein MotE (MotC chaperone)
MRVFKINYEMPDNKTFTAGILADNKDKALAFLKKVVKNITRVNSISSSDTDVHGIDDNIIDKILKGRPSGDENAEVIEKLKEKMMALENRTKLKDEQLEMETEKIKKLQESLVKKDLEIKELRDKGVENFVCETCGNSFTTAKGLKIHKKNKGH